MVLEVEGKSSVDVLVLTVIQPELDAALGALGIAEGSRTTIDNMVYYQGYIQSERMGRDYHVVVTCIGSAGNPRAAAATAAAIAAQRPRAVLLMGIAAGVRDKIRIGEVVLAERVVAYEPAALLRDKDGAREQPRPEIDRPELGMLQGAVAYRSPPDRLRQLFERAGGTIPAPMVDKEAEYRKHVADSLGAKLGTIASGEKLLRDPQKLLSVRELYGKVEVGEMEATGFVEGCRQYDKPWMVIRGISDFGDELKDDRFHTFAACAAAAVLADFLSHGLELDTSDARVATTQGVSGNAARPGKPLNRGPSPFVFGRVLLSDDEMVGREGIQRTLRERIDRQQPVELLGERLMGKSTLLRWVERSIFPGRPVVWLDAPNAMTPASMVRAIAMACRRPDLAVPLEGATATAEQAATCLCQMMPMVLLINDADNLARYGKGFEEGFFEHLRALVQNGELTWVSASHRDLYSQFQAKGLTSRFLNDATRIHVGALQEDEARKLASRVGDDKIATRMLRAVGGFAHGLQWLGDEYQRHQDLEAAIDAFTVDARPIFQAWWSALSAEQQRLLRTCAMGNPTLREIDDTSRRHLRALASRGLVNERSEERDFTIGPELWRGFVAHAR